MPKIIELAQRKLERSPHRSGPARCMNCKHDWQCVAPAGVTVFECPSCHTMRDVYMGVPCTENPQWRCKCGEWVFFVDSQGPYCANCGTRPDLLNLGR